MNVCGEERLHANSWENPRRCTRLIRVKQVFLLVEPLWTMWTLLCALLFLVFPVKKEGVR